MEFRRPFPNSGTKVPKNGFDYLVYKTNGKVYAKNGKTGRIDF